MSSLSSSLGTAKLVSRHFHHRKEASYRGARIPSWKLYNDSQKDKLNGSHSHDKNLRRINCAISNAEVASFEENGTVNFEEDVVALDELSETNPTTSNDVETAKINKVPSVATAVVHAGKILTR